MEPSEGTGQAPVPLRLVVLGAYGLIGSAVTRRLLEAGHRVTGVGRSDTTAKAAHPDISWHIADIGAMSVDDWQALCADADAVINASGALQDGARDSLDAIHVTAPVRLAKALAGSDTRVVQISAPGVSTEASTAFFRSKARGEAALRSADLPLVILRPTLVLAPAAYGGTALLRAGAALPGVVPNVLPDSTIACVHIDDLSQAVLDAVEGRLPAGTDVDVTGAGAESLTDLMRRTRAWLGLPKARVTLPVPAFALKLLTKAADLTGYFGWRSPLRSTALQALDDGVAGDPAALPNAGGKACRDLDAIFQTLPRTVQDRWFARSYLALPVVILGLSLFWLASGLIGLVQLPEATSVLTSRGIGDSTAIAAVVGGGLLDIALGLLILIRRYAKAACLGMILLSLGYLAAGTLLTPDLWADPLGPFVKVLPAILLAWITLGLLDDR